MCFWKQPGLYVWNLKIEISSFLEILTTVKIETPRMQDPTVFGDICFTQQFTHLEFLNSIRKSILGIFNFSILVYHKISTSSVIGLFDVVILLYQRIGAILMSMFLYKQ